MPDFHLGIVDASIIVAYFAFIFWRGFRYAKTHENAEEYFLAGRSLAWPLVGLSLFASNISSSSLVGMAGSGYATGFSVFSYEWMSAPVLIILAIFFLPLYLRSRIFTLPEFLERRYDARARYYFSGLTILTNIGVDTAATLYAGGLVIQLVFPSVPLWQTILALAVLSGLYTIAGGLLAVVYTDAIQAVLLTIGSVFVTVLAFQKVGSWDAVRAVTPSEHFHIFRPAGDEALPWPGVFTGVFLLGFYFWCTNQFIVQRALGARDIRHGQWGALFAGLLKVVVPLFLMILPGTMARVLYPDLEQANLVYPTLLFDLLPVGLLGLVLAGLIAAMMSSIDSALNSASTLITMDFYRKLRPRTSREGLMWVGRAFTFVFMLAAAAWAPRIHDFPTLWEYLQSALSYIVPPIVTLYLLGVFWPRANAHGAFAAIVVGVAGAAGLLAFGQADWMPKIHFLYVATLLFGACAGTHVAMSLLTAPPDAERIRECLWTRRLHAEETASLRGTPWYLNYRRQAIALLAITVLVLVWFG